MMTELLKQNPAPGQSKESTGVGAAHEQPESTGEEVILMELIYS